MAAARGYDAVVISLGGMGRAAYHLSRRDRAQRRLSLRRLL